MEDKERIMNKLKGKLIVSCQGLETEPMHGSYIMGRFAKAAVEGGASGIRANTVSDITEIKKIVNVPLIGIIKPVYDDSKVYITPTMKEVEELVKAGVDIIAIDGTKRIRPNGMTLGKMVKEIKEKYPEQLLMADVSDFEEAVTAENLGFDFIGTTMRSYTEYTEGIKIPDFEFIEKLSKMLKTPIIAEGGISNPQELKEAIDSGAFCAVVGSAITRPQNITRGFVKAIP